MEEFAKIYHGLFIDIVEAKEGGKVVNGQGVRINPINNDLFYVEDEDGWWAFSEKSSDSKEKLKEEYDGVRKRKIKFDCTIVFREKTAGRGASEYLDEVLKEGSPQYLVNKFFFLN